MKLIIYGEDGLTLWALTHRLGEILEAAQVPATDDVTVFYRPSFGRRGAREGGTSAQFGEFDAIIATPDAVLLVEAKWDRSPELDGTVLRIAAHQAHRHRVMRWYIERWLEHASTDGKDFFEGVVPEELRGLALPSSDKLLAKNLIHVLRSIAPSDRTRVPLVKDVLLYLDGRPEGTAPRVEVIGSADPDRRSIDFVVAHVRCASQAGAEHRFIELHPSAPSDTSVIA